MRLLVSHINYPAQFRRLVPAWLELGHEVVFLANQKEWHANFHPDLTVIPCNPSRVSQGSLVHPYLKRFETAILAGQSFYREASQLRDNGWYPDCIISHVGFGNGLFLRDCFPESLRIGLVEWFYNSHGSDVDFLPPHKVTNDHLLCLRTWNSETLLEISSLDRIVTPTFWQRNQFPAIFRDKIEVFHEGIDTNKLSSLKTKQISHNFPLPDDPDIEVMTYVSRCFEEYRGFPQAIESIAHLQAMRPRLHVLIAGSDGQAYGHPRSDGVKWSEWAKKSFHLDPHRTHWLGSLQEDQYHQLLALSDVHLYLTVPFVLSWSLLEAMAVGCSIVSCKTEPVMEVLEDGNSAILVDFFDVKSQVEALDSVLTDRKLALRLSCSAQKRAAMYSFQNGLKRWNGLLMPL